MFLPIYSPNLNPIEHIWTPLKKSLRHGLLKVKDKVSFIAKACLALCELDAAT